MISNFNESNISFIYGDLGQTDTAWQPGDFDLSSNNNRCLSVCDESSSNNSNSNSVCTNAVQATIE